MEYQKLIEPVGKTGKGPLSAKVRAALDDYVRRPWVAIKQIAADNGVDYENLSSVINKNRAYIRQESDRLFSEAREIAQQVMIDLACQKDYKAAAFILQCSGITPTTKTIVETTDISITIGKDQTDGE